MVMKKIEFSLLGVLLIAASGLAGCEYYAADHVRTIQAAPIQKTETEKTPVTHNEAKDEIVAPAADESWRSEKEALEKKIAELEKAIEGAKPTPPPVAATPPPPAATPPAVTPPTETPKEVPPPAVVPVKPPLPSSALHQKAGNLSERLGLTESPAPQKELALDGSDRTSFWTEQGGTGGARFHANCGFGEVVVGYKLRSGDVIDRMDTIVCKSLKEVAAGTIGGFVDVPVENGGLDGGELHLITASEGEAMVGWNAKAGDYQPNDDDTLTLIVEFQPLSARVLPEIGVINESREGDKFGLGADSRKNYAWEWTDNRCPDGYVLTGVQGLAGNYLDNLGGFCTRVVAKDL
jgi:hypothetical protein